MAAVVASPINDSPPSSPPPSSKPNDNDSVADHPTRPPTRPAANVKRSNLDLEQNPFEMSFSRGSGSSGHSGDSASSSNNPPKRKSNSPSATIQNNPTAPSDESSPRKSTVSPKPTLPPLSAIAEATEGHGFPWGFTSSDLNGSLRSGPLSPAMLAGPRNAPGPLGSNAATTIAAHNTLATYNRGHGHLGPLALDPSSSFIRTGLTPDVGRTGLTPLVGGPASFPPPSPNTAAFLAMVTNNNQVTTLNGATITPNTLSALTGAVLNGSNNNGNLAQPASGTSDAHHPHPLSVSHVPSFPQSYNQSHATQQQQQNSNGIDPAASTFRPSSTDYATTAQNAAADAANGLFLLSQAHQELTKREEQQLQAQAAAAAAAGTTTRGAAKKANIHTSPVSDHQTTNSAPTANGKRKSMDSTSKAPTTKRPRASTGASTRGGGRRKSTAEDHPSPEDDMGFDMDDDDDMMGGSPPPSGARGNKKPETEEDKRRNFLERNRQAALKCRQRKKAWLSSLQQKVELLSAENERLQSTIVSMRDEVTRLSAVVVAHRDCGLGGVIVPAGAAGAGMMHPGSLAHPSLAHGPGIGMGAPQHHQTQQQPHRPLPSNGGGSSHQNGGGNGQGGITPLAVSVGAPQSNGAASGYGY